MGYSGGKCRNSTSRHGFEHEYRSIVYEAFDYETLVLMIKHSTPSLKSSYDSQESYCNPDYNLIRYGSLKVGDENVYLQVYTWHHKAILITRFGNLNLHFSFFVYGSLELALINLQNVQEYSQNQKEKYFGTAALVGEKSYLPLHFVIVLDLYSYRLDCKSNN